MGNTVAVTALVAVSLSLQGCNFDTASEMCQGDSCNCYLNFYGMDANISIGRTQIEHASRRIMLMGIANKAKNANETDCCLAMNKLFKAQISGSTSQPEDLQAF